MQNHTFSPKLVSKLIKQAGFKSKAEFSREMGFTSNAVHLWGDKNPVPCYFLKVLEWAKKAKKYDELMSDLKNA